MRTLTELFRSASVFVLIALSKYLDLRKTDHFKYGLDNALRLGR